MVAKMISLALCVIAAVGTVNSQADKYPAGVNPHLCPNYPHCDNALLGAHASAAAGRGYAAPAPQYAASHYAAPAPQYAASHYAAAPSYSAAPAYGAYGHGPAAVVPVAEGYPAGVDPHSCPNYPYCGPTPAHVPAASYKSWAAPVTYAQAAPAPAYQNYGGHAGAYAYASPSKAAERYPADVDPRACPNYPYCH
ncbi:vitelline membrane-like protein [Hetaerina americana]|uniref:vitelline membrane-like protein n=1 Tax=Hetaerina americana TaxID=62018 RepID=UPI003A7F1281